MKKKLVSLMLIIAMTFSFVSCTNNESSEPSATDSTDSDDDSYSAIDNPPILSVLDTDTLPESITVTLKEVPEDSPSEEEQAKFNEAYDLLYNDNAGEAASAFMAFPVLYPDSSLNDDAQNYLGICYNALSMPEYALDAFAKVITEYPDSLVISSAYYNIGYIYYHSYESPELSYPYYVAFLENATIDNTDVIEYAIQILSDETDINIIYNPPASTFSDDTESDSSSDEPESESEGEDDSSDENSTDNASYQRILDDYSEKIKEATPNLVEEYKDEAAEHSGDINELAKISNDKIGKLAEISNEGIEEMANIMHSNGDDYDTYEEWAGKLMDVYTEYAQEITDAYMDSAT